MSSPRCLLTGARSALGQAIAAALAADHDLVVLGRDPAALRRSFELLPGAGRHRVLAGDLTDIAGLAALLAGEIEEAGPIANLVHAAGMSRPGPLRLLKPNAADQIFRVNVLSAIELLRVLSSAQNARSLSQAVLISSVAAERGCPGFIGYSTAKAALAGLCRSFAVEFTGKAAVVNLCLGPLRAKTDVPFDLAANLPDERLLDPTEISTFVRRLLGGGLNLVTGQTITLDRGFSLRLAS
jgi:NAD(P)-dependent dehydrogenase (short-subunit alcohol dehydrogenase family)